MRSIAVLCVMLISITAHAEDAEQALRSANEAFEKAWSARDTSAIEKLWSHESYVFVIHPSSKAPELGWDSVKKSFEAQMSRYTDFAISMTGTRVHVDGSTALLVGLESFTGKRLDGEIVQGNAIGTRGFEKRGDQWLIVFHQATPIR
jgi:ketosteroid isomerase-like protein